MREMIDTDRQTENIRQTVPCGLPRDSPGQHVNPRVRTTLWSQDHQPWSPPSMGPEPASLTTHDNGKTSPRAPGRGVSPCLKIPVVEAFLLWIWKALPTHPGCLSWGCKNAFPGRVTLCRPEYPAEFTAQERERLESLPFASGSRVEFLHRESLIRWFGVLTPGRLRARLSPEVHLGNNSARPKVTQHAQGPFPT